MTESGKISRGTTQVGEVRRPLAAVSKITGANNIVFFCQDEDWILDRRDPVAAEMVKLMQKATMKTKLYQHRGTYRMRAWVVPETAQKSDLVKNTGPFGRQGR